MAINAQAAQATSPPADPILQFLAISSTYFSLPVTRVFVTLGLYGSGEFVDPPQYRCTALSASRRACA